MENPSLYLEYPKHRIRALFHGHLIADSDRVIIAHQGFLPAQVYFPREDVETAALSRADRSSYCALKGDARYYTLVRDRSVIEHAAWSYEGPLEAAEDLRDMIAFDAHYVEIQEDVREDAMWDAQAERMSDYIRHTDSGSGRSQQAPWTPNVSRPGENALEYDDDRP